MLKNERRVVRGEVAIDFSKHQSLIKASNTKKSSSLSLSVSHFVMVVVVAKLLLLLQLSMRDANVNLSEMNE